MAEVQRPARPLTGRSALITGVSRPGGIGATLARRLGSDGARLFLTGWAESDSTWARDADPRGGEAIGDDLRREGIDALYREVDLSDPSAPGRLVREARSVLGRLDILVVNHARSATESLFELTAEELDLSFAVNSRSTLLLVRHFAEQHDGPNGGRVVLFTSGQYHGAMPGELPYIASKAVVQQLTPSLAVELAPRGITVNCVDPGPNDTGYATEELHRWVTDAIPAGRWGTPHDAARLVAWLCSDESDWVTGQTIASDGGWSAHAGGRRSPGS